MAAGISTGLPAPTRKKKAVAASPLLQVAGESSISQLHKELEEREISKPDKVKTEPLDETLSEVSEERTELSDEERPFKPFGFSASGFGFPGYSYPEGRYKLPSSEESEDELSEKSSSRTHTPKELRDQGVSPEFTRFLVSLLEQHRMANDIKWPVRGAKEAPKFNPDEPAELLRYIAQVEEIYEGKTPSDEIKKKGLCKYAPSVTEQEWMAFDSYESGKTYDEFKEELINSYPEAAMLEKGSLARLEQICRENQRIGPKDLKALLSFKRAFAMEAKKLQKPPVVIENHALVTKFANCLTDTFRENVFARLDMAMNQGNGLKEMLTKWGVQMTAPAQGNNQAPAPPTVPRRLEDRYQWKEVVEAAETMARNLNPGSERWEELARSSRPGAATSPAVTVKTEPAYLTPVKEDIETLKQDISHVRDGMVTQSKMQKELLEVFKSLQQKLSQPAPIPQPVQPIYQPQQAIPSMPYQQPNGGYQQPYMGQQRSYASQGPRYQNQEGRQNAGQCHYCHQPGHFIINCPARQLHLESGKIILENGRVRFPDGKQIPWEPADKTPREKVEEFHAVKETNAQFYHCDSEIPGMMQMPYKDARVSLYTNKPRDTRDEVIEKMRHEVEAQTVLNHNIVQPTISQPTASTPVASTVGVGAGTEDEKIQWMKMFEEKLGEERNRTVKELLEQLLTRPGMVNPVDESQQGFL